ncbi:MAG: OmpA family protein, partial [Pseudomonadota bacterium]
MSRIGTKLVVAALGATVGMSAGAEEVEARWDDWSASVMGMYVDPDNDRFDNDEGTGGRLGFGHPLGDSFTVELSGMGNNLTRGQRNGDDWQYQLGVDGIFWLHDGAVSPYLLAGGGASYLDHATGSDTAPYANAGVGVKVPLWEDRLSLRAEARYTADWADDAGGNAEFGDSRFLIGVSIPLFGPPETPEPEVRTETKVIEREKVVEKIPDMQPLDGVTFEFDSATLTPNGETVLDRIARDLEYHDHVTVEIRGHTDSVGSEEYNRKLSKDR